MNILWDFRLFSYGYGNRGVGIYTASMADAIINSDSGGNIFIWGQKDRIPERFHALPARWIEYTPRSWKSDCFIIPLLIVKYQIDIFHYWIALGPIFYMGMGLFHTCKTCCVVHDCGVEFWDESAICVSTKKTLYWKIQKLLFPKSDRIVCNSRATQSDVERLFKGSKAKSIVLYPPVRFNGKRQHVERLRRFVTLAGEAHKNTDAVIQAFQSFRRIHSGYSLVVAGEQSGPHCRDPGVVFTTMDDYQQLLATSTGCIVCSLCEGLGLPALEAMSVGCPIILSDLVVFRETCMDAACYVDPRNVASIVCGMERCSQDVEEWSRRCEQGAIRYEKMSAGCGEEWVRLYRDLAGK